METTLSCNIVQNYAYVQMYPGTTNDVLLYVCDHLTLIKIFQCKKVNIQIKEVVVSFTMYALLL